MNKRITNQKKREKLFTIEKLARMSVDDINNLNIQDDMSIGYFIKEICIEVSTLKRYIQHV